MKPLPIVLALVSAVMIVALLVIKHSDNAQLETTATALTDCSNRLDSAQSQITIRDGMILTLSNRLDAAQTMAVASSNQLAEAQASVTSDAEQLAALKKQVADGQAEFVALNRSLMDLTNQTATQIAVLTNQLAQTKENLAAVNKDFALLENRFRIDVAERTLLERRFNQLPEVQAQLNKLELHPGSWSTPESIYAGLDVEVKSNGTFHVIAQN
jgi:chromosome segregation ATPase